MANAHKIADSMAASYVELHGISKAHGGYEAVWAQMYPLANGIAEGITPFEKAVKKVLKAQQKRLDVLQKRGIPDPRNLTPTTFADYEPNDTLVKQQSERLIKRSMNGDRKSVV